MMQAERNRFEVFVSRLQVAAGAWACGGPLRDRLRHLWFALDACPNIADPSDCRIVRRVCAGLPCIFVRTPERPAPHSDASLRTGSQQRAERAVRYLIENSTNPRLGLHTVARAMGLSHWYLCRLFVKETGYSYGAHLRRLRVIRATSLLSRQDLSIKEVAYRAGFTSTSELDRQFRRELKLTPSQFRRASE